MAVTVTVTVVVAVVVAECVGVGLTVAVAEAEDMITSCVPCSGTVAIRNSSELSLVRLRGVLLAGPGVRSNSI